MTLKEFRQTFNALSDEKKEQFVVELYRRKNRQEKEMEGIVLECIREGKELPPQKARIPNLSAIDKTLQKEWEKVLSYRMRQRRVFMQFKRKITESHKELTACPPQAAGYEKAVELLSKMYWMLIWGETGPFPVYDIFGELRLSQDDFFRTICSMRLANGYTREALGDLVDLCCHKEYDSTTIFWMQDTIFASFLRNGDLRQDMMDRLEEEICSLLDCSEGDALRTAFKYSLLYFAVAREETGDEIALQDLKRLFSESSWDKFETFMKRSGALES